MGAAMSLADWIKGEAALGKSSLRKNLGSGDIGITAGLSTAAGCDRRIMNAMAKGAAFNPIDADVATGVTVTDTATKPTELTVSIPVQSGGSLVNHGTRYRVWGGAPIVDSSIRILVNSVSKPSSGYGGNLMRVAILTDAPKLAFRVGGASVYYRVLVDGRFVSKTPDQTSATNYEYIVVDFSSVAKMRRIEVELLVAGGGLRSIDLLPNYRITAPQRANVRAAFYSDSYGAGTGVNLGGQAIPRVMADLLGIDDIWDLSLGGTGYETAGEAWVFEDHVDDIATCSPDLLIIAGGTNDPADSTTLSASVSSFLTAARAQAPLCPILVLGPWSKNTGPASGIVSIEGKVSAAVEAMSDPRMAFIPVSPVASSSLSWVFGTGRTGATAGNGNADIYMGGLNGSDGSHPNAAGHEYIGRSAAYAAREALYSMLGGGA